MIGTHKIPLYGITRQYTNLREEILDISDKIYSSGQLLDGEYTNFFEERMAQRVGSSYAVTVNSCTQALVFSLIALNLPQEEKPYVLIPSISFIATLNAVLWANMIPVFCDVDPDTGLIDLDNIPVSIDKISAVMYVNLLGNIVDQEKLTLYMNFFTNKHISIIEDAAQSFGAKWDNKPSGSLGTISCLSFDPTKNFANYGSGGMILTNEPSIHSAICDLKNNGKFSDHSTIGTNSKMSEVDCAQMLVKIKYFDRWQERRQKIAEFYNDNISQNENLRLIPIRSKVTHAWSKYVVHTSKYNLISHLRTRGIESKPTYPYPLYEEAVGANFHNGSSIMLGAMQFSRSSVSLPIYPELTDLEVEEIVNAVNLCTY